MTRPSDRAVLTTTLGGEGVPAETAGGKGAALDRLIRLGVPVPTCGVVTADAYRQFVEAPQLRDLIDELASRPVPAPAHHAAARERVDQAFLSVPFPPELGSHIAELAAEVGSGGPLAVRSSATAEDLTGASFAGQYRSFLDVEPDEVADAVRLTWASLWHPAPRVYRRFRSLDETDLAMAVILMRMLDPTEAGVLFTTDPGGTGGELRLEVVSGLGERLVSGAATPEVTVLARNGAAAELATISEPLGELARISLEIEAEMGAPQDIEWAVENGRVHIVQSRPITTIGALERPTDPFDTVVDPDTTYTTAGIAEMVPGLLPPRLWELNSLAIEEGLRCLFVGLGAEVSELDRPHSLLARIRGRAALDFDAMASAVRSVPGGSSQELEREYLGQASRREAPSQAAGGGATQVVRLARARLSATQEAATMTRTAERLVEAEPRLRQLSDRGLLAYRARVVQIAVRTMAAETAVAALAAAAFRGVERRLAREIGPDEATALTRRATRHAGAGSTLTSVVDDLGDRLRAEPTLAGVAEESEWDAAAARLAQSEIGRAFHDDVVAALAQVGSTSVCGGTTWVEAAPTAWRALVAPRDERDDSGCDDDLPGGRWLRREARTATEMLAGRERAKSAVMTVGGLVWRVDREVARRLDAEDRIETADDIDLLLGREMRDLLEGSGPTPADIARRRRLLAEQGLDRSLPQVFRGSPTTSRRRPVMAEEFTGWGASAGRFEGPARIVRSAAGDGLQRGEVLVTRRTDASWAPLFLIAGAVVLEEGGPLSHASIVSRELGLPAVINVPGIVERLEREVGVTVICVDGTTGEVLIHADDDPDREFPDEGDGAPAAPDPTGGIAPVPTPPDGQDVSRLGVFVTGLIGAGALLSGLMTVSGALSGRRTRARIQARAERTSEVLANAVVNGFEAAAESAVGLRSRGFYGRVAAALGLLALLLVAHGVNRPDGSRWTPLWRTADLSAAAELLAAATVVGLAALWWPRVPPVVRRLLPSSGREGPTAAEIVGGRGQIAVGLSVGLVAVVAAMVGAGSSALRRADESIYRRIDAGADADRWGPEWIDVLGSSEVMIPVALFVTVAVARCRPLAYAIPTTIAVAGSLHLGLAWLVPRDRPTMGESAGGLDSFPGGFVLEVTLVLGFLPLAMAVLTRRPARWASPLAVFLWIVLVVDAVRLGAHWPSDSLAGLAIGIAFLTVVHGVYRTPTLHGRCWDCPGQRRLADAAPPQEERVQNH